MNIRKAKSEDSNKIASLIFLAMEDIVYYFIGEKDKKKAILFMASLIKEKNNQYSYENCWVIEDQNTIVGAAIVYNGANLEELRKPVLNKINSNFNRHLYIENETQAGEFYIDCVGVDSNQQGKGIGTKIFRFLIAEYVEKQNQTLGLLVDNENPNAKKLYLKLGFEIIGNKTLAGKPMEHLQFKNKKKQ